MEESISLLLLSLLILLFVLFWPIAAIWALNTLFGTAIPMSFKTWLAAVVLMALFRLGNTNTSSKK